MANSVSNGELHWLCFEQWHYRGKTAGRALKALFILSASAFLLSPAQAMINASVGGDSGSLYIHGALMESACHLEMTSSYQDVALGETGTADMRFVGARGTSVQFELRLEGCPQTHSTGSGVRNAGSVSAGNNPAVRVAFWGVRDADSPQLVKAQGISGLGLRLEDSHGRDVRLGSHGELLPLTSGQNTLYYRVRPERTKAVLVPGRYQAQINFHLNYD